MKKKGFIKNYGKLLEILLTAIVVLIIILSVLIYLHSVDEKASELSDKTSATYISSNNEKGENGLFIANIEDDLTSYIEEHDPDLKKLRTFTYKIPDEKFYIELSVHKIELKKTEQKNDDEETEPEIGYSFEITKIVDELHDINAKTNYSDIKKIEYKTGNSNYATVLNLIAANDTRYMVCVENAYYFLGSDIETVSYIYDHFYYLSYNKDYSPLRDATSCDNDVLENIEDFNLNDVYYRYGKINFLKDYYQKTSSTAYSVRERCAELENAENEE